MDYTDHTLRRYTKAMRCVVAPALGLVGVLGNTLNIFVLGWRCYQGKMDMLERGAMYGLISLAVSDLLFCLSIIPHAVFLENKMRFESCQFQCLFQMYGLYVHDLSVKISTWVTVLIAISRYVVVCHPLRARLVIVTSSTKLCIIIINIFWLLFLIPILFTYKSLEISDQTADNMTQMGGLTSNASNRWISQKEDKFVYIDTGEFSDNQVLRQTFLYLWVTIGYFVPLLVLTFSNVCLIRALRNSAMVRERHLAGGNDVRRHAHTRQVNSTITRTLILLIVFFIILVSPSQIVGFYNSVSGERSLDQLLNMEFLLMLSNVLVTANYASHFFLYCTVSSSFRRTLVSMLRAISQQFLNPNCSRCHHRRVNGSSDNIKLELTTLKKKSFKFDTNVSRQTNAAKPNEENMFSIIEATPKSIGSVMCKNRRNSITVTSILANDLSIETDSR